MKVGYFDAEGCVLLVVDGAGTGSPPGTAFTCELPADATADTIYFDTDAGEMAFRQPFALTITRNHVAGIPVGTIATIAGETETIGDGEIEFVADVEETVRVALEHPHYLYEVVAVETGP